MPKPRYIQNTEGRAAIVLEPANTARSLLGEECLGLLLLLCIHGGACHRVINKTLKVFAIARNRAPALAVAGELRVAAALVKDMAERSRKVPV